MNIALILAGGSGIRMHREKPKQFIPVEGKPILAYTISRFQNHPRIDRIIIVCVEGWEEYVLSLCSEQGFHKVGCVVSGGETALDSIRKGIKALKCAPDDIIVIHDGVRPMVDAASIDAVIEDCQKYGGAISAIPTVEHIVYMGENRTDIQYLSREKTFTTFTPQAYHFGDIIDAYRIMDESGVGQGSAFIGTLMMDVGKPVCLSKGSEFNIKITTPKDLALFNLLLTESKL